MGIDIPIRASIGLLWPIASRFYRDDEEFGYRPDLDKVEQAHQTIRSIRREVDEISTDKPFQSGMKYLDKKVSAYYKKRFEEVNEKERTTNELLGDWIQSQVGDQNWMSYQGNNIYFWKLLNGYVLNDRKDELPFEFTYYSVDEILSKFKANSDEEEDNDDEDRGSSSYDWVVKVEHEHSDFLAWVITKVPSNSPDVLFNKNCIVWVPESIYQNYFRNGNKCDPLTSCVWNNSEGFVEVTRMSSESALNKPVYRTDTIECTTEYRGELRKVSKRIHRCVDQGIYPSVMLYGPAGCGKTTFNDWFARKNGLRTVKFNADNFSIQTIKASLASNLHSISPDLIIIEDFDVVFEGLSNGKGPLEAVRRFNGLNAVVLYTANHIDRMPTAMKRPGRIDWIIECGHPNAEERAAVRDVLTDKVGIDIPEDMLDKVDEFHQNHTGAHVEELLSRAKALGWDDDFVFEFSFQQTGNRSHG